MASGDWGGSHKTKGSETVRISERGKHVFKLTVKNAAGVKTATVKVHGVPQGQGASSSRSPTS